ncbi:MAG: cytochrome C oxidase subunit IV family protein [Bacteroidetes bacterium]|nr:cytochrome C oxidase subunit IV family protein [Bacteroidota bacterium]
MNNNKIENYDPITFVPQTESHGTKDIWKTLIILSLITVLDIILYFVMPVSMFRNVVFIFFGLVKAYYIVGSFMHLKHEKFELILMILVPSVFIIALVSGMLYDGNFWLSFK